METIVRGRDGRLYRYIMNDTDMDTDDDDDDEDESLDCMYQEPTNVRDRSVENVPVVSIPVHQVTSNASSRPSAAGAMNKEVHVVASSSSMEDEDDDVDLVASMEDQMPVADHLLLVL